MLPEQTLQAHLDLGARWLLPARDGTSDLARHARDDPFERIGALAAERCIPLSAPRMGERVGLQTPAVDDGMVAWLMSIAGAAPCSMRASCDMMKGGMRHSMHVTRIHFECRLNCFVNGTCVCREGLHVLQLANVLLRRCDASDVSGMFCLLS